MLKRPEARREQPPHHALIASERTLANLVALCLRHCSCTSAIAAGPDEARARLEQERPALLVVDVAIADGSGLSLLQPRRGRELPATLALIRPSERWSSLDAFARGADQVIAVPFTPDELAVRAFALLRRFDVATDLTRAEPLDGLALNIDETVRIADSTLELTPSQNSILYFLAANFRRPVFIDEIRRHSWGLGPHATELEVRRRVAEVQAVLADAAGPQVVSANGGFSLR